MLPPSHAFKGSVKGIRSGDIDLTKMSWERVTVAPHSVEWQVEGDGPLSVKSNYHKRFM
jgi:hypothetical protein